MFGVSPLTAVHSRPKSIVRFICLCSPRSLTFCWKLRTYRNAQAHIDMTIVDAIRATCTPGMFPPVRIHSNSVQLEFCGAELVYSNPVRQAFEEAHATFGANRVVSCVLSLGSGKPIFNPETSVQSDTFAELSRDLVVASDRVSMELEVQIGNSIVYHRFSVDGGLFSYEGCPLNDENAIFVRTRAYIEQPRVGRELENCVDASLGAGECLLRDICMSHLVPPMSAC